MDFRIEKTDCRSGEYMYKHKRLKNHIGDLLNQYKGKCLDEDDRFITINFSSVDSYMGFFTILNKDYMVPIEKEEK